MRENRSILILMLILALAVGFVGCSDDDDDDPVSPVDDDFAAVENYLDWTKTDYVVYPGNAANLGAAHEGQDPSVVRVVYENDDAMITDGMYAEGSIIFKEMFRWGDNGTKDYVARMAMVKRASDFNPDNNNWEWLVLNDAGDGIEAQGADLMDGACNSCHAVAVDNVGTDYVFAHPTEHVVPAGDEFSFFSDVKANGTVVETEQGAGDFLGQAHGVNDPDLMRDIIVYQAGAKFHDGEFPIGSAFLKEVHYADGSYANQGEGAWTAMVKRGGDYDPTHGNWEYFMINPETQTVDRGKLQMCIDCHAAAPNDGGGDYIFNHPDLGF